MKQSLAHLKKLVACCDTPDAIPDLRAHVLAHAEGYASLLGAPSSAALCAAVDQAAPEDLVQRLRGTIAQAFEKTNDARFARLSRQRADAAARVIATIAKSFLTWELDREALRAASLLPRNGAVRFVAARGVPYDVDARALRALLTLRKDARPILYPLAPAPLVVHWGERGQMTFTNLRRVGRSFPAQCIHLPMIDRLDGTIDARELEQAAE